MISFYIFDTFNRWFITGTPLLLFPRTPCMYICMQVSSIVVGSVISSCQCFTWNTLFQLAGLAKKPMFCCLVFSGP